jgi:hypothetical protein
MFLQLKILGNISLSPFSPARNAGPLRSRLLCSLALPAQVRPDSQTAWHKDCLSLWDLEILEVQSDTQVTLW